MSFGCGAGSCGGGGGGFSGAPFGPVGIGCDSGVGSGAGSGFGAGSGCGAGSFGVVTTPVSPGAGTTGSCVGSTGAVVVVSTVVVVGAALDTSATCT
jgi:hypothetical protein